MRFNFQPGRLSALLLLASLIMAVLTASVFAAESNSATTITIVDSAGRTVDLPYPVKTVVVLWGNPAKEMRALGAVDSIVGMDQSTKDEVDKGTLPELADASKNPENLAWLEENDLYGLMIGLNISQIEAKARQGDVEQELSYKGLTWRLRHDPTCYYDDLAPSRQFKYIRKPVLVIHGACDLNVPVDDAFMVERERELREKGNMDVELIIIPDADHSFQAVPEDEELRLRERMSRESFFLEVLIFWHQSFQDRSKAAIISSFLAGLGM
jgi:pimeloyl-ACP methyl ester carboxylesterase